MDETKVREPDLRNAARTGRTPRTAAEDVMIRTCPSGRVGPRFRIEPFEPAYLATHRSGVLAERVAAGLRELEDCCACLRNGHVNWLAGETRVCHTGRYARVASAFPHFGEEDCLRGGNGSGNHSACAKRLRRGPASARMPQARSKAAPESVRESGPSAEPGVKAAMVSDSPVPGGNPR
jgi:hypothetical protein